MSSYQAFDAQPPSRLVALYAAPSPSPGIGILTPRFVSQVVAPASAVLPPYAQPSRVQQQQPSLPYVISPYTAANPDSNDATVNHPFARGGPYMTAGSPACFPGESGAVALTPIIATTSTATPAARMPSYTITHAGTGTLALHAARSPLPIARSSTRTETVLFTDPTRGPASVSSQHIDPYLLTALVGSASGVQASETCDSKGSFHVLGNANGTQRSPQVCPAGASSAAPGRLPFNATQTQGGSGGTALIFAEPTNAARGESSSGERPLVNPILASTRPAYGVPFTTQLDTGRWSGRLPPAVQLGAPAADGTSQSTGPMSHSNSRVGLGIVGVGPVNDRRHANVSDGAIPRRRSGRGTGSCAVPSRGTARLFVGQLPATATTEDLEVIFSCYGRVLQVKIQRENAHSGGGGQRHNTTVDAPGRTLGGKRRKCGGWEHGENSGGGDGVTGCYAFVTYESMIEADAAIAALHGKYTLTEFMPPPRPPPLCSMFFDSGSDVGSPPLVSGAMESIAVSHSVAFSPSPSQAVALPFAPPHSLSPSVVTTIPATPRGCAGSFQSMLGGGTCLARERGLAKIPMVRSHSVRVPPPPPPMSVRCRSGGRPLQVSYNQTTTNLSKYGYAHAIALHKSNAHNPVPMKAGSPTHYSWKCKLRASENQAPKQ